MTLNKLVRPDYFKYYAKNLEKITFNDNYLSLPKLKATTPGFQHPPPFGRNPIPPPRHLINHPMNVFPNGVQNFAPINNNAPPIGIPPMGVPRIGPPPINFPMITPPF